MRTTAVAEGRGSGHVGLSRGEIGHSLPLPLIDGTEPDKFARYVL